MKYALILSSAATLLATVPASAEEVGVGVGAGPAGAGVTVGVAPDRYRERDRTVIKEREPRDKTVIIKKERERAPDRKVILDHDD